MPQVAVALLKIGFFVFEAFAGAAAAATLGAGAAVAIGAAVVVGGTLIAKQAMSLFEIEIPTVDTDASRQRTVKSTTEPQKIIYGEALVSGPISFIGLSGTDNSDLYQTIVLAGHELNDITDIHMDDVVITDSQINGGSDAGGNVTAGKFGPKNSSTICVIKKHLGEASQTADVLLTGPFANYTSAHRGDGIAYLAMKWVLNEDSAETWEKFAPSNVKALVQGKSIYDPRLEFAAVGTRGQDTTNASYITYSTNPALCVVDYLTDTYLGMGVSVSKIDWDSVTTAADGCDVSVSVPNGTESRFTCNGVVFATDSHQKNINKILSSMNGSLVYSNGKYILHAGIYEAPTETLTEDDLIGAISIRTSLERSDRFNTIKGLFIDPSQNHKSSEFPKVQLADAVTRDNNEILEKEVQYPMTNSSYMAQRLSNKLIQLSDQQKVVTFPANLSALRITAGDRVQVTVEELNWSNKVFQCAGWTFSEDGGVNLTLREDSSTSYADPAVNEYSTITATGVITDAFRGVPSPSGLSATAGLKSNELNWVNPAKPNDFGTIYVYASPNANFSSAVKIGETDGTQFIHDASNSADSVVSGDVRYYWVRAVKNVGTDAASQSNLEPNADPNTTVFATVGRVNWADVAGSTNAPEDNATVGARLSANAGDTNGNLVDTDGTTKIIDTTIKNEVLRQEVLLVEVEAGEVLDLETGQDVQVQNLGDVAIYVSDSNQTLNTSINAVANNLSALEVVLADLTSGVSEVFVQATAPVAGVGGIPNPIPDFSRWYDSSANNQPYYWDGSAWQDLRDGQTTQNAAAITNLQTSLTTTNSNVTTNASAITVLDATSVTQGNSITSITSDVTALETTVNDATTGVAATSTALGNLTTRVTTAEGSITTNASDITTLQTDVTTAEGSITTNASAISGLDTRVTTAEGTIVAQSADITALQNVVDNPSAGIIANADAITALTTRVEDNEDGVLVNAGSVTSLNATYTEDLHFRTQAEDENDDLIDLETSGTVELQDLTDFVSGSSAAIQSLTVQTIANDDGIQTQAIQLTALESTVNNPTTGVAANATGVSNLSTRVTSAEGSITSQAADIVSLQADLTVAEGSITANSSGLSALDVRVTSAEGSITSQASDIVTLQSGLTTANTNISTNASATSALDTRVTSAEGSITSQASDITTLQADLTSAESDISANSTAVSGLDTRVTSAEGSITTISSDVTTLQSDLTTANSGISGNSTAITNLDTRVTSTEGSITSQSQSITSLQSSLSTTDSNVSTNATAISGQATAISGLQTSVTSINGSITSISSDVTTLSTTVGNNTTSISTNATSIDGVEANYTVKIDNNNRVSGFGLLSTTAESTPTSEFIIIADKFRVVDPASTASAPLQPFTVTSQKIRMGTNVEIDGDLVTLGTISADRISIDNVTLDTDGAGNLIIATDGVDTAQIANLAITTTKIDNLAVGTAQIDNLSVETLKIAGNAVTIPSSAYSTASVNNTTAQTITWTSTGAPTFIAASWTQNGSGNAGTYGGTVSIKYGTTTLWAQSFTNQPNNREQQEAVNISFTPSGGSATVTLVCTNTDGTYSMSNRSLFALETKK
jgi:predicted  nucleic acid-binding Zn-ribbon protein